MKSPKSDPQREQLYAMENVKFRWWLRSETAWPRLVTLAARLCRQHGVPQVKLVRRRGKSNAGEYDWATRCISLHGGSDGDDYTGRNVPVLLHELAHHIVEHRYLRVAGELTVADHGPEFVAIYRRMLAAEGIVPRDVFDVWCRAYGVQ